MITFSEFKTKVQAAGYIAVDFGNFHWQIQDGMVIVNYYPTKQTIYVVGTVKGQHGSIEDAIKCAALGQKKATVKAGRFKDYSYHKRRLLKINPRCRWCGCLLTEKTATIEHIIPLARGGSNHPDNLTLACEKDNKDNADSMKLLKKEHRQRSAF
jgi:5-methylcytosine-specific restriction endonuclease McrA